MAAIEELLLELVRERRGRCGAQPLKVAGPASGRARKTRQPDHAPSCQGQGAHHHRGPPGVPSRLEDGIRRAIGSGILCRTACTASVVVLSILSVSRKKPPE